jgi:hypothetical protein
MLFLTYMGTPKYGVETSGDQEIAQELAPVEGVGSVRALAYEDYKNGLYCTDNLDADHPLALHNWGTQPPPVQILPDTAKPVMCQKVPDSMRDLMTEYKNLVGQYDGKEPNMIGIMNVEDWQTGLKRVDLQMIWNVPDLAADGSLQYNVDGSIKLTNVTWPVPQLDADGKIVLDASGQAVTKNTPGYGILTSGKALFIDQSSEYHSSGASS